MKPILKTLCFSLFLSVILTSCVKQKPVPTSLQRTYTGIYREIYRGQAWIQTQRGAELEIKSSQLTQQAIDKNLFRVFLSKEPDPWRWREVYTSTVPSFNVYYQAEAGRVTIIAPGGMAGVADVYIELQ